VLAEVGSPYVGCALDTANSCTVFCDPEDDIQDLAPYTATAHMKDMLMVDTCRMKALHCLPFTLIPMLPNGVALGEGNVHIVGAIKTPGKWNPHAEGLHLIIETGWIRYGPDDDTQQVLTGIFERSVSYLRDVLQTLGDE